MLNAFRSHHKLSSFTSPCTTLWATRNLWVRSFRVWGCLIRTNTCFSILINVVSREIRAAYVAVRSKPCWIMVMQNFVAIVQWKGFTTFSGIFLQVVIVVRRAQWTEGRQLLIRRSVGWEFVSMNIWWFIIACVDTIEIHKVIVSIWHIFTSAIELFLWNVWLISAYDNGITVSRGGVCIALRRRQTGFIKITFIRNVAGIQNINTRWQSVSCLKLSFVWIVRFFCNAYVIGYQHPRKYGGDSARVREQSTRVKDKLVIGWCVHQTGNIMWHVAFTDEDINYFVGTVFHVLTLMNQNKSMYHSLKNVSGS